MALTMKSVGKAAGEMVQEVKPQFSLTNSHGETILTGSKKPDFLEDGAVLQGHAPHREREARACASP